MGFLRYGIAALALAIAAPLAAQTASGTALGGTPAKQEAPVSAVQWVKDYDEALKLATEQKKQIFVFVRRRC